MVFLMPPDRVPFVDALLFFLFPPPPENLSGLTRQETLRGKLDWRTSVRRGYIFRDIRGMGVGRREVSLIPQWKCEIRLLVNICKHE